MEKRKAKRKIAENEKKIGFFSFWFFLFCRRRRQTTRRVATARALRTGRQHRREPEHELERANEQDRVRDARRRDAVKHRDCRAAQKRDDSGAQ